MSSSLRLGLVGSKIVWFDLNKKKISYIDLTSLEKERKVDQKGLVNWSLVKVQSFTIRDLLHGLSKEQI